MNKTLLIVGLVAGTLVSSLAQATVTAPALSADDSIIVAREGSSGGNRQRQRHGAPGLAEDATDGMTLAREGSSGGNRQRQRRGAPGLAEDATDGMTLAREGNSQRQGRTRGGPNFGA